MTSTMHETTTAYLQRPEGRIAYDVQGDGPLLVCVPGMGDLRSAFRHVIPAFVAAGYRVATMDLRGHGDSDATFTVYDDVEAGRDLLALIEHLGGPALVLGSSMGAAAATWAAAEDPAAIGGLALLGPFVRQLPVPAAKTWALRLALLRPWGRAAWRMAYRSFHATRPADLGEHVGDIRRSLDRTAHWKAFVTTTRVSHAPVEARLSEVRVPVLVIMGDKDPDFPDPAAEAATVGELLGGASLLVPEAGHYPMAERPEIVAPAIVDLAQRVFPGA